MNIKNVGKSVFAFAVAVAASSGFANGAPVVGNVVMSQGDSERLVTITYTLSSVPAIVTLDVQTNCTVSGEERWCSIGGPAVCTARGAVWRKITADDLVDGVYKITWRPDLSWEGHMIAEKSARAVLTAWSTDNSPDYMVVDLSSGASPNTERYYPSADFLPGSFPGQVGAVTNNPFYKTTKLLMRKIMAKDIEWTMGSTAADAWRSDNENTVQVSLDKNYYIGVFEITQSQWAEVVPFPSGAPLYVYEGSMRPMEKISIDHIRGSNWPLAPAAGSFLGSLNAKSGLDFDLPSEAQWEYAARSGYGTGYWNDGSVIELERKASYFGKWDGNGNLTLLGRFTGNHTGNNVATVDPDDGGTAVVGSYKPSSWGLYDMHGNVYEMCLDWYEDDVSGYKGQVNVDKTSPEKTLSGATVADRVVRGGGYPYFASAARPSHRIAFSGSNQAFGLRVVCTAGLK